MDKADAQDVKINLTKMLSGTSVTILDKELRIKQNILKHIEHYMNINNITSNHKQYSSGIDKIKELKQEIKEIKKDLENE